MPNYTVHLMRNWDWLYKYKQELGAEKISEYINRVYQLLTKMKPGSFFSIEKNVKAENRDLFIKVSCMFIDELYDSQSSLLYEFNSDATIIRHREKIEYTPLLKRKLLNGNNRRPIQQNQ